MDEERNWFTTEEVRKEVYDNLISIGTVRNLCIRGEIPSMRVGSDVDGEGKPTRRRILIPAYFVQEMKAKARGLKDNEA